jgi:hypothetical protein
LLDTLPNFGCPINIFLSLLFLNTLNIPPPNCISISRSVHSSCSLSYDKTPDSPKRIFHKMQSRVSSSNFYYPLVP